MMTPAINDFDSEVPFLDALMDFGPANIEDAALQDAARRVIRGGGKQPDIQDFVQKLWDLGDKAPKELMLATAGLLNWINTYNFYGLRDSGKALKMRAALYRDAGVPGDWPDASTDPERASTAPAPGMMPVPPAALPTDPAAMLAALKAAGLDPSTFLAQVQAEADAEAGVEP